MPRLSGKPIHAVENDSDEDEDEWTDSWLITGGSDTSLRKWDVASGRVLDRMGVGRVRGERTLVWTVGVLGFVLSFLRSSDIFILFDQGWNNCFWRFVRHGQVLGLENLYPIIFIPGSWCRRTMHDYFPRAFASLFYSTSSIFKLRMAERSILPVLIKRWSNSP